MSSSKDNLERFVERCLNEAATRQDPARFLRVNALKAQDWLAQLDIATSFDRPLPAHLDGLTAFDLSDAMDRLNGAARGCERRAA